MTLVARLAFFFILGVSVPTTSCVYRFTNQHVRIPVGVKNIAVEAVYDTSREVIPHEVLWDSLQRAFAADGHLKLTSQGNADALLRVHLRQFVDIPHGSAEEQGLAKDEGIGGYPPPPPSQFRRITQAREFTTKQYLRMGIDAQVVDLYSKNVIFNKSYSVSQTFQSFRSETTVAQRKTHFLMFEEARQAKLKEMSDEIAHNVIRDFLVGR